MILSSIFTYKQAYAENTPPQYAFYIPQNSFQNNTDIAKEEYLRNSRIDATISPSDHDYEEKEEQAITKKIKNLQTYKLIKSENEKLERISKKLNLYQLEDDPQSTITIPPQKKHTIKKPTKVTPNTTPSKAPQIKSIAEVLSDLPYPDNTLPKFQQVYADYIMDLRVLYYKKRLPANTKQEASLSKANSILRFDVN